MRQLQHLALFFFLALTIQSLAAKRDPASPLNIHLIAHTHDDIGWLKTVDEYFWGLRNDVQNAGVQYILDSVIRALNRNPARKFIYVEVGFFYRWWKNADDIMKNMTYKVVQNGQLEFINGGWCMHDEANPYYEDMIGNMAVGHEFLKNTFGAIPTIGWQIDPFGHSNTNPAFYSQMGFNGLWFGRIDFQDYNRRMNTSNMELIWNPTTSQFEENAIFTGVLYPSLYVWPNAAPYGNFGYDMNWWPPADPVIDNLNLEGYNVDNYSKNFVAYFEDMANHYKTNNVMKTLGMDFEYQAAHIDFKNVDKIINYVNSNPDLFPNVTIQYSTPSIYLQAVHEAALANEVAFENKTDDFFPYADGSNAYWTGYFTSRVAVKGNVRETGRFFQSVKRLVAYKFWDNSTQYLAQNTTTVTDALRQLEQTMGVLQHHDAVAGTEKQRVADDYIYLLDRDRMRVHQQVFNPLLKELAQNKTGYTGDFQLCALNISASFCNATVVLANNTAVVVGIFNPLEAQSRLIRIKVTTPNVSVADAAGNNITADVICANMSDLTDCDLYFNAPLPDYDVAFFHLAPSQVSIQVAKQLTIPPGNLFERYQVGQNQFITVFGGLSTFEWEDNGNVSSFSVQLNYYKAYCANNDQNSGAYIFRPAPGNLDRSSPYLTPTASHIFQGNVVTIISTIYNTSLVNMRFSDSPTGDIELETFIDSIDVSDNIGKEIVLIVKTNIANNNTFYTDSNGQEMQKRILNYRPTWNFTTVQPASGNYYPVNAAIYVEDPSSGERVTLVTDRSQGGTSLHPGEIELMVHRRLVCDDGRGVDEALLETNSVTNKGLAQWFKHNIVFTWPGAQSQARTVQFRNDQPPVVALGVVTSKDMRTLRASAKDIFNLKTGFTLPTNVKVLIKSVDNSTFVIWFHNLNEDVYLEVDVSFFDEAFALAYEYQLSELSLSANQQKADVITNKYTWSTNNQTKSRVQVINEDYKDGVVGLRPLEIRTIQVDVQWYE